MMLTNYLGEELVILLPSSVTRLRVLLLKPEEPTSGLADVSGAVVILPVTCWCHFRAKNDGHF